MIDILTGMYRAQAARAAGKPGKMFDWDKAARRILEVQPQLAEAGLVEDWGCTCGYIWVDGQPTQDTGCFYPFSYWATPVLELDGVQEECWLPGDETPYPDNPSEWPERALRLLRGEIIETTAIRPGLLRLEHHDT